MIAGDHWMKSCYQRAQQSSLEFRVWHSLIVHELMNLKTLTTDGNSIEKLLGIHYEPKSHLNLAIKTAFTVLRILFPIVGISYVVIESREVFVVRQLSNLTLFVAFFMIANFQMSTSRALLRTTQHRAGSKAAQLAGIMFIATLFAGVDAALDTFFSQYDLSSNWPLAFSLFLLGWLCNSTAVIFAVVSMHQFIGILSNFIQSSITGLEDISDGITSNYR